MSSNEEKLATFFKQHPQIRYEIPGSPGFSELRNCFWKELGVDPLSIAQPKTAEDVASIISFTTSNGIEITIRSGGHDMYGRTFVKDALCIDMRKINYVEVSDDRKTARIGGGILHDKLADELCKHNLAAPVTSIGSVGFAGWCTLGGYSYFGSNWGMGIDIVVGAKVVNFEGKVVEADEGMLRAIRGGGGSVGVITEFRIKVFPLKQMLAGTILFQSDSVSSTFRSYTKGYNDLAKEGLPNELGLYLSPLNTPMGRVIGVTFVWSSDDHEKGRPYLERLRSWGTVVMDTVKEMTIPAWQKDFSRFLPDAMYGAQNAASVRLFELTDEVVEVFAEAIEKMPSDPATFVGFHQQRITSEAAQNGESVYGVLRSHFMIEIISATTTPEAVPESARWALELKNALVKTDPKNIEPSAYINITAPEDSDYPAIYGSNWTKLVEAKRKHDPRNVFKHCGPKFDELGAVNGAFAAAPA